MPRRVGVKAGFKAEVEEGGFTGESPEDDLRRDDVCRPEAGDRARPHKVTTAEAID